jgi:hypothetical protein
VAFDLSTAQPVQNPPAPGGGGGFDLSTAMPDGVDPMAVHLQRLAQLQDDIKRSEEEKQGPMGAAWEVSKNFLKGSGDTALSLGTGLVSTPLAGVGGLLTSPLGFIPGMEGVGARNVERLQRALTWAPRSDVGKEAGENIAKPFELLAQGADWAGEKTREGTGSNVLATGVNTGIQMLPALLLKGRAKPVAGASTEAAAASTAAENLAKAQTYAADRMGVDWNSLSKQVQDKLTTIAADAGKLDQLDPAAIAREAKLQSLKVPVPATRGQITRDPVAIRNEGNVSETNAGKPIRDVHLAANQALLDNLDVLKGKVSGTGKTAATATTAEQTGASVQSAARAKLDVAKAKVKALYDKADKAGETLQTVDTKKVLDTVSDSIDQPHYSYAQSWLKANAERVKSGEITVRDLEKLRQQAVAKALNGGEDAHYAGQLIKSLDEVTEGAGGKLYQQARAARKAQALEFEEQGAVSDLVSNASRTDRATALESTTKTITNGSLEDVRKIKKTLLTGGDEVTRASGKKAWRDVRAQVVQDIKDASTKGVALNSDGTPNLGASALKRAVDKYGPEKLEEIFGAGSSKEIYKILDAAREVKTAPPSAAVGSSTVQNLLAFLEKGIEKVPVLGTPVVEVARGVSQLRKIGAGGREAKNALKTPLTEALKEGEAKAKRAKALGTADQIDPSIGPLSLMGDAQRKQMQEQQLINALSSRKK